MKAFILLPIGIVNSDQKQKEVTARIQPENIEYYYPGFFDGTVVVMKSGNSMLTTLSSDQIDNVLKQYKKVGTGFGILEIKTN